MTIYISFDIETTGSVPGKHAMLSVAFEAYRKTYNAWTGERGWITVCDFSGNMTPPDLSPGDDPYTSQMWDPATLKWWQAQSVEARTETFSTPYSAESVMTDLLRTLYEIRDRYPEDRHVWCAYPATFDFPFVRHYALAYPTSRALWEGLYPQPEDDKPNLVLDGIACLDMGTMAATLLGKPYWAVRKSDWPARWKPETLTPHVAIDDAVMQGHTLRAMLDDIELRGGVI